MQTRITTQEYEQALSKGFDALAEPHAIAAKYMANYHLLELTYSNGLIVRIDPRRSDVLSNVPASLLAHPYVTPGGDGLLFDKAGLSVSIPGLLAQLLPADAARQKVASIMGSIRSDVKAKASRANGVKGGRPRKVLAMG